MLWPNFNYLATCARSVDLLGPTRNKIVHGRKLPKVTTQVFDASPENLMMVMRLYLVRNKVVINPGLFPVLQEEFELYYDFMLNQDNFCRKKDTEWLSNQATRTPVPDFRKVEVMQLCIPNLLKVRSYRSADTANLYLALILPFIKPVIVKDFECILWVYGQLMS